MKILIIAKVMKNPEILKDIKNPSFDVCMAAVRQDGLALRWIKEQTTEICLEAFRQNPDALEFVRDIKLVTVNDLLSIAYEKLNSMVECIDILTCYDTEFCRDMEKYFDK